MNLDNFKQLLKECYTKDLCYIKVRDLWTEDNRCFGMCAITALLINDYFGGLICKIHVGEISHYYNYIDDEIVDLTKEQFTSVIDYKDYEIIDREAILVEDTIKRYTLLKSRFIDKFLKQIDDKIFKCNKCGGLVEKFPKQKSVYIAHTNDIVLVGEAPANNGWRKSGLLWRDINGKLLPSGVVLQRLFDMINRKILETTFLEAVKCYPIERKNLKKCLGNCKKYMFDQLTMLQPKIVLTLGDAPTRCLLDFDFKNFSDVVGKVYEVNNLKVLPIYHPSPASPVGYKGNISIFENLKEYLDSGDF